MTALLKEIPYDQLNSLIRTDGIRLETGPFTTHLTTQLTDVINNLILLYADHQVSLEPGFSDFHLAIQHSGLLRRWIKPQVNFSFDGISPFRPLPRNQAYAIFEWGLNWCIANYAHYYLMIHAAVLERKGNAIILPGVPGAGKSTLCAGLSLGGWRLFSDEMALIEPQSRQLISNPRPISLKNDSISLIRALSPDAVFGMTIEETTKGTVTHLKSSTSSVQRSAEQSVPSIIVFPHYTAGASTALAPLTKSRAFMMLCENAFNYSVLGKSGFSTLKAVIDQSDCYQFEYSNLNDAVALFNSLSDELEASVGRSQEA
ncbi:MAG: HprK-related kinase A [Magnetovibrio sp.]|nr:HprK-related kinase A [Magnetovibrio sp.]